MWKPFFSFREDGIVIAISVWQTLIELLWSILYFSCVFVTEGQSIFIMECMLLLTYFMNYVIFPSFYLLADARFRNIFILECMLLITYFMNYVIFPSFYLLADSRFRNVFKQKGGSKAIWLALKQKYE